MLSHRSSTPSHRAWIEHARQQSDEVDVRAAELKSVGPANDSAVLGTDSFPGYTLEREIHRGAQGIVFRAMQQSTGRRVALKLLHNQALGGPLERARFEREMHILAALRHPNIVAIHDGGSHNGRFFLVMDYVAGQPLDLFMAGRTHSIRQTLELFVQICDAVNGAHLRGIIHRDIKPANIRVDATGQPFVLDFGLAKVTSDAQGESLSKNFAMARTLTGQFLGSLPWAAPEQVEADPEQIDTRTDVYALGVVLFQILTAKFPYPVTGPIKEAMDAVLHTAPLSPRSIRREIDDELETIVLKCLRKERDRRYQTAGELARDVRRYLVGESIDAKRDSGWYMLKKSLRRHRLPVAAAGGFVVLLAVFGLAMASARTRAEREADKSRKVLAFLQNMLAGVDPEEIGPRALTIREVLDHAAARLERELVDQPEIAASVHQTLGNHYSNLGFYFDADRHLRKALDLRRTFATGDDPEVADALADFAANLQEKRDLDAAEAPSREALEMRRRLFGNESLEVAASLHDQAALFMELWRPREAEPLARDSLAIRRRLLGPEHAEVANSTGMLGYCFMALGRLDEAEDATRKAVDMMRRLPGDNERALASRLTFLSNVLRARAKHVEEEAALREAIDIRSRRLAQDHPALAWNLFCLAQVRWKRGDLDEAESNCRRALDIYLKHRGPQHVDIADCQQLMAEILESRSSFVEAQTWWQSCLDMRRSVLPEGHPDILFAQNALANNRAWQSGIPKDGP